MTGVYLEKLRALKSQNGAVEALPKLTKHSPAVDVTQRATANQRFARAPSRAFVFSPARQRGGGAALGGGPPPPLPGARGGAPGGGPPPLPRRVGRKGGGARLARPRPFRPPGPAGAAASELQPPV